MDDGGTIATRQSEGSPETHKIRTDTTTGQAEASGETSRPEMVVDSRSEMEEDWEESEAPSRDETPEPSEPDLPQTEQVMTRKRKLSKDREPTKFIPRFTERKEESTRNKQDASQTEGDWMRKLGDKAKKIWRTSPPRERIQKPDDQQYV